MRPGLYTNAQRAAQCIWRETKGYEPFEKGWAGYELFEKGWTGYETFERGWQGYEPFERGWTGYELSEGGPDCTGGLGRSFRLRTPRMTRRGSPP